MPAPETQAISCRIASEKVEILERLAKATVRPRSWHIEQALDAYLDLQAWQVEHIEKSIAELDAGEGISHETVKTELRKLGKRGRKARKGGSPR